MEDYIVYSIKYGDPPEWPPSGIEAGTDMLALRKLSPEPGPPTLAVIAMPVPAGGEARIAVTAAALHRIPDWVGEYAAALAEPLACVCNAMLDPNAVNPGDRVVIVGAGAVGMLAGQVARAAGGRVLLLGTESDIDRLAVAVSLGFEVCRIERAEDRARLDDEVVKPRDRRGHRMFGQPPGDRDRARGTAPARNADPDGLISGDVAIPYKETVVRELGVRAAIGGSPAAWLRVERLLEARHVYPRPLVTSVLPLREWPLAFERFDRREGIKTLFDPRLP